MTKAIKEFTVSLMVPADVRDGINDLAVKLDRSKSWVMLQAIREYLARELPKHKPRKA